MYPRSKLSTATGHLSFTSISACIVCGGQEVPRTNKPNDYRQRQPKQQRPGRQRLWRVARVQESGRVSSSRWRERPCSRRPSSFRIATHLFLRTLRCRHRLTPPATLLEKCARARSPSQASRPDVHAAVALALLLLPPPASRMDRTRSRAVAAEQSDDMHESVAQ